MICQINGALTSFIYYFSCFFLRLIITCRLCVIYVREDNYSNVYVMITQLIWTIWIPMSSIPQKADKLNLSLSGYTGIRIMLMICHLTFIMHLYQFQLNANRHNSISHSFKLNVFLHNSIVMIYSWIIKLGWVILTLNTEFHHFH